MASTLVLLRHGQSTWNQENLFTGWYDADLSSQGVAEARAAGRTLRDAEVELDVLHTSLQTRAIRTANLALEEMSRTWLPVRRHWRLNERHYGDLQGKDKKQTSDEFGADQVKIWRRSYDIPPPPLASDDPRSLRGDPRYAHLAPDVIPDTECLKDVVTRMLPYWYDDIVPDLMARKVTLVAAHGNSLRAIVKHLDQISDEAVVALNIPTGIPLLYELDDDLKPTADGGRYLDPEAAAASIEAVKNQGKK
jgi:2,3-bisphosphoglycerate-dependent phosphoglycerate mutase